MKNVRATQMKTVIVLGCDEYEQIIADMYSDKVSVHLSLEGIWYESGDDLFDNETLFADLAKYFDVSNITSVHCDDCDYPGIWICYQA